MAFFRCIHQCGDAILFLCGIGLITSV